MNRVQWNQVTNFLVKLIIPSILVIFALFYISHAHAAAAEEGIAGIADHVVGQLGALAKLIIAAAYVAGVGFSVGAVLKFKQHKDNPTQIPIGTPIALMFIAASLLFLPSIFGVAGHTIFADGYTVAPYGTVWGAS